MIVNETNRESPFVHPKMQIKSSAELLAQAVAAGKVAIAKNILQGFANDQERREALNFRNCHHGKPLGTAIEQGDVPMTELILSYLTDEEAISDHQGSTLDNILECNETAVLIALKQCAWKKQYPHLSNYPSEAMLNALRKRDVFQILRDPS
jgi:hypothetical protein